MALNLDDSYYVDKFANKEVRLEPEASLLTVTFEPGAAVAVATAFEHYGLASQSITEGRGLGLAVVSNLNYGEFAALPLASHPMVVDFIPVYRDQEGGRHYVLPGQLDLQFVDGIGPEHALEVIERMGGRNVGIVRTPGFYSVAVTSGQSLFAAVRAFSSLAEVEFAVPSLIGEELPLDLTEEVDCSAGPVPAGRLPNEGVAYCEPCFSKLWALKNDGQELFGVRGTKCVDISIIDAWVVTLGIPEVVIAVVDTGMDLEHPDLVPNLLSREGENWNFVPGGTADPIDVKGHGTRVCGVAAAALNGVGIVGVAPRCSLMPLRVNLNGELKTRADAIYYVAERASRDRHRRYVINLSWVMPCDYTGVRRAIAVALSAGAIVVAGVGESKLGESGKDMEQGPSTYPASYTGVIAVTATDQNDRKGEIVDFGRRIDLCAPGVSICTTDLGGTYSFRNGTSFAAAYVSGLAALILSINKELTNDMVRSLLKQSCDPIDNKNPEQEGRLGAGRINASAAVLATLSFTCLAIARMNPSELEASTQG